MPCPYEAIEARTEEPVLLKQELEPELIVF
jgi:hypothetical protein